MEMVVQPDRPAPVVRFLMDTGYFLQVVAVRDIGRAVAQTLTNPSLWGSRTLNVAADSVTGTDIASVMAAHWSSPVTYERMPAPTGSVLARLRKLIECGVLGNGADVAATRAAIPGMSDFRSWVR